MQSSDATNGQAEYTRPLPPPSDSQCNGNGHGAQRKPHQCESEKNPVFVRFGKRVQQVNRNSRPEQSLENKQPTNYLKTGAARQGARRGFDRRRRGLRIFFLAGFLFP